MFKQLKVAVGMLVEAGKGGYLNGATIRCTLFYLVVGSAAGLIKDSAEQDAFLDYAAELWAQDGLF